ncbi:MAG: DUF2142 domain-containing protein [Actinomycetota bacterium]|jgi:uncharacterized membrane protein
MTRPARLSVPRLYLLIAIPVGLFLTLLIPPTQVLDEAEHFHRVWQITQGNLVADTRVDPVTGVETTGGTYDRCVREYLDHFMKVASSPEPFRVHDFWFDTPPCSPRSRVAVFGEPMATYSAWSYPGQVVGVAIGRALGLALPITFYLGRLLGVATTIAMCWWAIRTAPRLQLLLAFVALLPMSMIGASGYSPDGMVLGCALILTAYCLRFATLDAPRPSRVDVAVIVAALMALVVSKPPYAVFLLLFLAYRPHLFGDRRRTTKVLACMAAVPLLATLLWNTLGYPSGAVLGAAGADPGSQLHWVITHPLAYLNTLSDTAFSAESQEFVMKGWVGAFGMFRSGVGDTPLIMTVFVLLAAAMLGALMMAEAGPRLATASRAAAIRTWVPLGVGFAGVLAVCTSAYLSWTSVGGSRIVGVQGRYLIAFLALPAVTVALRHERSNATVGVRATVVVILTLSIAAFVKVLFYFY